MKKILSIAVILILGTQIVKAQSFSPDRPGIGNGSFITPEEVFGVEAGIEFQTSDFINQFSVGQLLLRYGVMKDLELRANMGSFTSQEVQLTGSSNNNSGLQDMSIGAKYNVISGEGLPNVSALASLSLPVGDDAYSSGEAVPGLTILADHAVNEDFSISSNLGYTFGVGNLDDNWLFTLTPGITLAENMGAYGGYAGQYFGNGFNQHWIEGGFTYGLESGAQLDANLGYETEGETFFIGFGFAQGF